MRPEVKAQWLEALRSGEYEQAEGVLHTSEGGDRFCCLGVLCDLAVKAGVEITVEEKDGEREYDGEGGVLPHSVMRWAGLPNPRPEVTIGTPQRKGLAELNDGGWEFEDLADLIERDL